MARQAPVADGATSEKVREVDFHTVFSKNYSQYGLFVVQDRALPDARDGLKPVHRRILYTMLEGGYVARGSHRKSAEIVGKVLGDRHPHGDTSVYDAMARMAQPFALRYPLIDGQGNWGANDGSPAAAYRYTEARLSPLAEALLSEDIRKSTVPLVPTYKGDEHVVEPVYLPGHIPPCVNPTDGIAVGISTTVPPHNLKETLAACLAMLDAGVLDGQPFSVDALLAHLPGPDFPDGGRVMAASGGLREYLETGRGKITVRGQVTLEQPSPTRRSLVITALPPVGRDRVIDSIEKAINDRHLDGLVPDHPLDETNEERTRIVLELKRDADPATVLEGLWKYTELQITVPIQLFFLFADKPFEPAIRPRQVGLVELLSYWLRHQLDVVERRLEHDLRAYRTRLAVVEALLLGSKNAREIVRIFQEADGRSEAKAAIARKYHLSEEQADVIAGMTLAQVTKPDVGRYEQEMRDLQARIARHEDLVTSRPARIALLRAELSETAERFGDARRTVIDASVAGQGVAVVAAHEARGSLAIALYADGTVKATSAEAFGAGARSVKADEKVIDVALVEGDAFVLAVSSAGTVYGLRVQDLEVTTRVARGAPVAAYLHVARGERIVRLLAVPAFAFTETGDRALYLVEFSAHGKIKKSRMTDYKAADAGGLISLKLAAGDNVCTALLSTGQGAYLLTTDQGQTLLFGDDKLSVQGRVGQGQAAISLPADATVVGAGWVEAGDEEAHSLLTATSAAQVKRTRVSEYPAKGRGTGGVATTILSPGERITAAQIVHDRQQVLLLADGMSTALRAADVTPLPRTRKAQPVSGMGTLPGAVRMVPLPMAVQRRE